MLCEVNGCQTDTGGNIDTICLHHWCESANMECQCGCQNEGK